jgi:uncharacterized protein (TIGR00304 family)
MILEAIAIGLILLGLFLVFKGLTEPGYIPPHEKERYYMEPEDVYEDEFENWKRKKAKKTDVKAGGVILIGPIPIVFGESKYAVYALVLSIILMLMSFIFLAWR